MRQTIRYFAFLAFFFGTTICPDAHGQGASIYNLNIDNGLPSNHVYGITIDRNGYMWIPTEKGVVKYNGYDAKVFNLSNGIPSEDVWHILEDKKGKLWLGNMSNEMGYIYKDAYHKAYFQNINHTIYPKDMRPLKDGIVFYSNNINDDRSFAICAETNDTISKYYLPERFPKSLGLKIYKNDSVAFQIVINSKGVPILLFNDTVFKVSEDNSTVLSELCRIKQKESWGTVVYSQIFIVGDFIIMEALASSNCFYALNIKDGSFKKIDIEKWCSAEEKICYLFCRKTNNDNFFYAFTTHRVLKFVCDSTIECVWSGPIEKFSSTGILGKKVNTFIYDTFWGNWLGTTNKGFYVNYDTLNPYRKEDRLNLDDCVFVGGKSDKSMFWWNPSTFTLVRLKKDNDVRYYKPDKLVNVKSVAYWGNDSFIVSGVGNNGCMWLNDKTGQMEYDKAILIASVKCHRGSGSQLAYISMYNTGLKTVGAPGDGIIDYERYTGLIHDSLRSDYWVYNNYKVTVFGQTRKKLRIFSNKELLQFGVSSVDQMIADNTYGNIFFKGNDRINMYDPDNGQYTSLFRNLYLKESGITIYKDMLIVAGRFGVLFCNIEGRQKLSAPMIRYNWKNINFTHVYYLQVSWDKVLLSTDKGIYTVSVPRKEEMSGIVANETSRWKLLVYYKDDMVSAKQGDTIAISQRYPQLRFDVINPNGCGKLKYFYKPDGGKEWHELNSNELIISPSLDPGEYHHFSLMAHDDVWKSDARDIYVYVQPYWWQKVFYSRFFWPGSILLILALIALIVIITGRIVMRNNIKRNLRLEIELKSVYSQINPHFVFNTLGTVMYFIKKKELDKAYDHVSKFSRLLRAYIKSSRNKYITLAAETENLNNYIQLQMVRFEDKFDYEIITEDTIRAEQVMIPALLLQPIVENAIDHGLFHKEGKGHLKIEFKKGNAENEICCIIDDDGVGRKRGGELSQNSLVKTESYGERLITDLVTVFNKYERIHIGIRYIDKVAPETGTTVTVTIKYLKDEK